MVQKKEPTWEEKLDEKMKSVEQKVDELGKKIEGKSEVWGKSVEKQAKSIVEKVEKSTPGGQTIFWGIAMIVIGFLWLGRNLGWFLFDIPWVPLSLIAVGIYMVLNHWDKEGKREDKT